MNADNTIALEIYAALEPKIRQTVEECTGNCVRRKKMMLSSVNDDGTVTLYDAVNTGNTITVPYIPNIGIKSLPSGHSVQVQWIYNDFSTAIAAATGKGYTESPGGETVEVVYPTLEEAKSYLDIS